VKILIAEDVAVAAFVLRNILQRAGHATVIVEDGSQILEVLERHPEIGLAFVDINMPGANGLEVVREMRTRVGIAEVPVAFATGDSDGQTVRRAAELGCIGYLLKPVNEPSRVLELVERALTVLPQVWGGLDDVGDRMELDMRAAKEVVFEMAAALEETLAKVGDGPLDEAGHAVLADAVERLDARRLAAALDRADHSGGVSPFLEREVRALLNDVRDVVPKAVGAA
jgi:CheY-like chemotaxis protein